MKASTSVVHEMFFLTHAAINRIKIIFVPLAAESLGGWHETAEREIRKLGSALARHTGQLEGEAISHLWGRLGILLQRGNAAILGNRVPAQPDPPIDGIL